MYLEINVLLLTDIFQCYTDSRNKAYGINQLYSSSTLNITLIAGLKCTVVKLDYTIFDSFRTLLENKKRGWPYIGMGNWHVKRGERKILSEEMNILYGWSMSHYLPTWHLHEIDFRCTNFSKEKHRSMRKEKSN